ncbi:MAG: hypothetical protein OSB34_12085 [Planktomarina sp.]|nr:hypothetical protein [Planktomarina sp.]
MIDLSILLGWQPSEMRALDVDDFLEFHRAAIKRNNKNVAQ